MKIIGVSNQKKIHEMCGKAWTHKLLDKQTQKIIYRSDIRPITKASPNHKHDTGGWESGTPTGSSEGSIPIKTPSVATVFIRSRQDDIDSSIVKPMLNLTHIISYNKFFSPPQENGEQITVKDNKLLTTSLTVDSTLKS